MSESEIMTLAELCAYLQIHKSTAYRLLAHGRIPCFRIGRKKYGDYRFVRKDIDQWMRDETARQTPAAFSNRPA